MPTRLPGLRLTILRRPGVWPALDKAGLALGEMPTGRPGRVTGTYEKLVTGLPYILAYVIAGTGKGEEVAIVRVIHTSRDWPAEGWPS